MKSAFEEYEVVNEEYQGHLDKEEDLNQSYQSFDETISSYIDTLEAANKYILKVEQSGVSQPSIAASSLLYLPKVEIEVFKGDPTKYHSFIAIFEESVEQHCCKT